MAELDYYVRNHDGQMGPLTKAQVAHMMVSGEIQPYDQIGHAQPGSSPGDQSFKIVRTTSIYSDRERLAEEGREEVRQQKERLGKIILTTEVAVNLSISERLGIVSAECVLGMNVFRDLFALVRDAVGGRSGSTQKVLRDAKETVLTELRRQAYELGADAVVAIDLDYGEFSGGGKSMMMCIANGTAVKLEEES